MNTHQQMCEQEKKFYWVLVPLMMIMVNLVALFTTYQLVR
jgi:hypothetical protein